VIYVTSLLSILFLVCLPVLANDKPADKPDPLNRVDTLLEGGGGPAVDTAVLLYFGQLESRQEAAAVLLGMVERLQETGDPRVAPALAAVLNRPGVFSRITPYSGDGPAYSPQGIVLKSTLHGPATDAWFDLMWEELTDAQRIDAMMNLVRQDPDIHFALTNEVLERAEGLGEPMRAAFYEHLLDADVKYDWRVSWVRNHIRRSMAYLLAAFPPSDQERQAILDSPRTMPRYIYLSAHGPPQEQWALELFKELMKENASRHATLRAVRSYASRVANEPEAVKQQYRAVLLEYGYKLLADFRKDQIDDWSRGVLSAIADDLFKYGKNADTLKFLVDLHEFFSEYDPTERELNDRLKRFLPPNIHYWMRNVEFRVDLWSEGDPSEEE